jgi:hypothetical protein
MKPLLLIILLFIIITGCRKRSINYGCDCSNAEQLIFQTGFEGTQILERSSNTDKFSGSDSILYSDWESFENNEIIGDIWINYEDGDYSQRIANIEPDSEDTTNNVLRFTIVEPHIKEGDHMKGRVNTIMSGNKCFKEIFQTISLKLHDDLACLETWDETFDWLTLFEFWNNSALHNESKRFRVSVGLVKSEAVSGGKLYFHVSATEWKTTHWNCVWKETNENIPVVFGEWQQIELYLKEGNADEGRFYMALISETNERQIVFDITGFTHHPKEKYPDGFTDFNPQKLYTGEDLINYMNENGKTLSVFWDNWALYINKRPIQD